MAPFYYSYKNIQETNYLGVLANFYNGAAGTLYGIDLVSIFQVTKSFSVSATAEVLHSRFASFPAADYSTQIPTGGVAQYTANAAGNQLPYAPRLTVDISGDHVVELPIGKLDFNITDAYNNGFYAEADNFLRQPAYDWLNVSIARTSPDERLNVSCGRAICLDKIVESEGVTDPPEGYTVDYSNPPRTYSLTVLYKFGSKL